MKKIHIFTAIAICASLLGGYTSAQAAAPTQVQNVQSIGGDYTKPIHITWNPLVSQNIQKYVVIVDGQYGLGTSSMYIATTTNQYTFPEYTLAPDLIFTFSVYAVNASGGGIASASTTVTTTGVPTSGTQSFTLGASCMDLLNLVSKYKDPFATYTMSADIDCSGVHFTPISFPTMYNRTFNGELDGQGHTIRNLKIEVVGNAGLFAGNNGYIHNINFVGGHVFGTKKVGLIAPYSYNGIYRHITTNVDISGGSYVGGIVGDSTITYIEDCTVTGDVRGSGSYVGGIVSSDAVGQFSVYNSRVVSTVSGEGSYVGGIIGYGLGDATVDSTITGSYVQGNVISEDGVVGGLAGQLNGVQIYNSYMKGSVEGNNRHTQGVHDIGGLVGYLTNGTITSSYFDGSIDGGYTNVGGLAGTLSNASGTVQVRFSFSTAAVAANGMLTSGQSVGGLVGTTASDTVYEKSYFFINKKSIPGSTCSSRYSGNAWLSMIHSDGCTGFLQKTSFYAQGNKLYTNEIGYLGQGWGDQVDGVIYWMWPGNDYPQLAHFVGSVITGRHDISRPFKRAYLKDRYGR